MERIASVNRLVRAMEEVQHVKAQTATMQKLSLQVLRPCTFQACQRSLSHREFPFRETIGMYQMTSNTYSDIYAVVCRIPKGQVATYGQIAQLAGLPRRARLVGYALSALNDSSVPWHRVINAKGEISRRSGGSEADELQRLLLEEEGIHFDAHGRIPLDRYRWRPK